MTSFISALDAIIGVLRTALLALGALTAAGAALSYAVRTRRISPFSGVARFTRNAIDPVFAPVERRVLRLGGRPAIAPWWALAAVVVLGLVLLGALGFVRGQLALVAFAASNGTRGLVTVLVTWTFGVLEVALVVRVLSSWFQLTPYSPWVRWAFALTEWLMRPLRRIIPPLGMIDITPIVAYFALSLLQGVVLRLIA